VERIGRERENEKVREKRMTERERCKGRERNRQRELMKNVSEGNREI